MGGEVEELIGILPDHILIEIFIRLPVTQLGLVACVSKRWTGIFRGDHLWQIAIAQTWPTAVTRKRWPGPIPRSSGRRRFMALYVSNNIVTSGSETDELAGHAYLYLKEQLELSNSPPPSSILHGTMIDQFIACGLSRDGAHKVVSEIWMAVINNLEENHHTFLLLKRLAKEGDLFLPYPYSRSYEVLWRVYDKLFTDFRDCFSRTDYCNLLGYVRSKFQPLPSTWLGY
ncbi:lipid-binding serum glycoprotein family protein [Rhynchospora pubera]|uniref:Lipid-binding serum glycoprotein family protein n=1 Tax=Rhynchospora pubera TaxID=906938 RepID=A0AAV8GCW4_9POAL|nr:lipid-binding serum glycoprotein family protein [Rhynchospora pubera]